MLFFVDMGQNVSTLYLGGDQFGDLYYITPINHYLFGVANQSEGKMNTYILEEGGTNHGADNIISCLYLELLRSGVIGGSGPPLKHLSSFRRGQL